MRIGLVRHFDIMEVFYESANECYKKCYHEW